MSLKRRNKNITKTNGLIVLVFRLSYFIFPFSTLCIVIKIEYAMFSKNSISITFIDEYKMSTFVTPHNITPVIS